ncbi:MAG TPA: DinB family protein [Thermoanaerobaculia bacterium]|nr:DinB family protein [Thermoanaerobaculia bacterium]
MTRPTPTDYAPPHASYVDLVDEDDILSAMQEQSSVTQKLLAQLDETRASYRYETGKWSVKELIGHVVDAERIIGYRALCVARGDTQPLPGFDESSYVANASFDSWKLGDLAEHYALVRRSNLVFFQNLQDEAWDRRGTANQYPVSVRGLAYVIVGHERHHLKVLREKYNIT